MLLSINFLVYGHSIFYFYSLVFTGMSHYIEHSNDEEEEVDKYICPWKYAYIGLDTYIHNILVLNIQAQWLDNINFSL